MSTARLSIIDVFQYLIYLLGRVIYNLYFHPLRKFPGPKLAAASRLPFFQALLSGRLPFYIQDLLRDYKSDVVRVAPDELAFQTAEAWNVIYGHRTHNAKTFDKDLRFYGTPVNGVPSLINSNWPDHARQRRLLAHAFSEKALREQEPLIQSYVDLLITKLHEQLTGSAQGIVDMVKWYNYTTFDLIGDLAFGESFDCLQTSEYHPWVSMIFTSIQAGSLLSVSRYIPAFERLLRLIVPKSMKRAREENFRLGQEKVDRRMANDVERPDFLSAILKYNDEKGMSIGEIHSNTFLLIVAGSETTATLLSGCTFHLLKNPAVLNKLVHEIRTFFEKDSDITLLEVSKLKYLLAVLDESLRMYPPVPIGLPRIVPEGGEMISASTLR